MDSELVHIYLSAIKSMEEEIKRLHICIKLQNYKKKQDAFQKRIHSLSSQIYTAQENLNSQNLKQSLSLTTDSPEKPSKSSDLVAAKATISAITQRINRARKKRTQDQGILEEKLKQINENLYTLVFKYNEAKRVNTKLKSEQGNLASERKTINGRYAKTTRILVKEKSTSEMADKVERMEQMVKAKILNINSLKRCLQHIKAEKPPENSEVKKILQAYQANEARLHGLAETKDNLKRKIQEIKNEMDVARTSPEKFSPAQANKNLREEIKRIETEISEKSKILKQIEKEKLLVQMKYSDTVKGMKIEPPVRNGKSLSNLVTHSSIMQGRNTNSNFSRDTDRKSKRSSVDIVNLMKRTTESTITKDVIKALDDYAPGKNITAKILAFNRGQFNLSSRPF